MLHLERERTHALPPLESRRARRRRAASWLLVALAAVLLFGLLIGGLVDVGHASRPYWRSINRSYAAQAVPIVTSSNASASALSTFMSEAPGLGRHQVQAQLEALVRITTDDALLATGLVPPEPSAPIATAFAASMDDRATAVGDLRGALFGLLGIQPSSSGTTTSEASGGSGAPAILTTSEAETRLQGVADLLRRSDQQYTAFQSATQSAPGHARMVDSVWLRDPAQWTSAQLAALTQALATAPSLAVVHHVVLTPNGVRLTPASVPPGAQAAAQNGAPPGASVLPPTTRLGVQAVVQNLGNVPESGVVVKASVQPSSGGAAEVESTRVSMPPGTAAIATLTHLRVQPSQTYTLTVTVVAPAGQSDRSGLSEAFTLWVAPATKSVSGG